MGGFASNFLSSTPVNTGKRNIISIWDLRYELEYFLSSVVVGRKAARLRSILANAISAVANWPMKAIGK